MTSRASERDGYVRSIITDVQLIGDRVAQNLKTISKTFSTDPDAQPLYHGTINLPTNLAIQIPAILSLPPVSPDLDQPNVTLTLSGQPVTDSLLSSCRTMPIPGPTLRYKKRTVSYRTGMQEKRPLGSFEVAMDAIQHGTDKVVKSFTYFDSRDDFFRETAYTVHRNFYEIIPAGDPCCLYFDVEHYSPSQFHADGSPSDNKLAITVATICYEAKCQWPELAVNPSPLDQVVVTTASRSAGAAYKHSFHINFPRVGFINNHGALRAFARHLSSLDALQAMSANFQPMALIDTSVYSRNQNLRIIESWKHHPRPTKEMALEFFPPRLHTMESLLQTLVTNVLNVTHWTREAQEQDNDAVLNMRSLLHTAGLDGVGHDRTSVTSHFSLPLHRPKSFRTEVYPENRM